jgi:hypothetical protein
VQNGFLRRNGLAQVVQTLFQKEIYQNMLCKTFFSEEIHLHNLCKPISKKKFAKTSCAKRFLKRNGIKPVLQNDFREEMELNQLCKTISRKKWN